MPPLPPLLPSFEDALPLAPSPPFPPTPPFPPVKTILLQEDFTCMEAACGMFKAKPPFPALPPSLPSDLLTIAFPPLPPLPPVKYNSLMYTTKVCATKAVAPDTASLPVVASCALAAVTFKDFPAKINLFTAMAVLTEFAEGMILQTFATSKYIV